MTNGADALAQVLAQNGVDTCFANPGTTEMHMVQALTGRHGIKNHLCLFEGVASGAADGYARMARRPAATLLHLGPGLANALANLHNARKASTPVLNLVGEHALDHIAHNAPLTSDIATLAAPMSKSVVTLTETSQIAAQTRQILTDMQTGTPGVGTLIVPNDVAWGQAAPGNVPPVDLPPLALPDDRTVEAAAKALKSDGAMLILGHPFITARMQELAYAICTATGATLMGEAATARTARGAGLPNLPRIPFQIDAALAHLKDVRQAVLAGAKAPVAFFAYPERPSALLPPACTETTLCTADDNLEGALEALAEAVGAKPVKADPGQLPAAPGEQAIDAEILGAAVANALPEGAIVIDESVTNGLYLYANGGTSPVAHDWINNRGGSIGYSMPVAIGAAVACPDRPVIVVTGDGSASYTPQSLWTMARSGLNITVVVLANRRYKILANEMSKIGAGEPDEGSDPLLSLDQPPIDWSALSKGYGVPATRVETGAALMQQIRRAVAEPGPSLIEAVM
ncbi:acetolactate synthase large subunit [Rhodalgimonas zhirmunskyi]|uniref:Acetolactate synthase large subunit n=1 Tax=Rhodalgimonas zhirmunskyi TaxID=2964767 RepID=A0AAJ1UEV3_9RHOB|nr:acetolactate synthase large subunit [Rhodoalgimonas zhirmunskyi]MDQ2094976.1 acetolactate synthase large subunit [Rhodoalgimonas zhirmunskyi]